MSRPLSVCMLIWNFHPTVGGTEMQCLRLSRELTKGGVRVLVLTQRPAGVPAREVLEGIEIVRLGTLRWPGRMVERLFGGPGGTGQERTAYGSRVPLAKAFRLLFTRFLPEYVWMARAFFALIRMRGGFAILHIHEAHWIAAFGVTAGRLLGRKTIVKEATTGSKGSLRHMLAPFRALAARGDAYAAISRAVAGDLAAAGVPQGRIRLIHNGIPLPKERWTGGDAARPYVLFVGNLGQQPIKGIDVLLDAWPEVARAFPGIPLKLAGGGNAGPLRKQAETLGISVSAEFLGARGDVRELMIGCRAFVLPSRREGMSNALVEALALGVPCVSTDVSGSQDLIRDGESGLLVPAENPQAMAEALMRLLGDEAFARRLGENGRATVERLCDMSKVAGSYTGLYRELADGGTAA